MLGYAIAWGATAYVGRIQIREEALWEARREGGFGTGGEETLELSCPMPFLVYVDCGVVHGLLAGRGYEATHLWVFGLNFQLSRSDWVS